MTLPAFKRNPRCPKCGHDGIHFEYTDGQKERSTCGFVNEMHLAEHIHLECSRCAYGKNRPWVMAIAENPDRIVGFNVFRDSTGVARG